MDSEQTFGLSEYLQTAEMVTGLSPAELFANVNIALAESAIAAPHASFAGQEKYPDPVVRTAILCSRIVRNHALTDGNKRVGYIALRSELDRQGIGWSVDEDEAVETILALAAGELSENDFVAWVCSHAKP